MKKIILPILMIFLMDTPKAQTTPQTAPVTKLSYEVACTRTDFLHKGLKEEYKEEPVAVGTTNENLLFVLWASKDGGFSITISAEGRNVSCLLLEGKELNILRKEINLGKPTRLH